MAEKEPTAGQPYFAGDTTPWLEARERLADADTYWLATVRTDGLPHLVPLLGVWVGGALHFVASRTSRKAKNLARDPHCVIAASKDALDLVVEGEATKVSGEVRLHRVAEAYMSKYGWPVTVRECAFYADGAPTAGPPPYAVYEVIPRRHSASPPKRGCSDRHAGASSERGASVLDTTAPEAALIRIGEPDRRRRQSE